MLQRHVEILLTIQVRRIAAHAALEPVVAGIVTRQAGEGVVILRSRRRDPGGDHRIFIGFQRLLRVAVLRLKTCGIAQHQRAVH